MPRVVIVDDDALVRTLLGTILTKQGIDVVGEASDGDEVVPAVQTHRPDVVLMDLRMARMQGVEATAAVCAQPDPPAIIVLTSFDTDEAVQRALQAGARGFLPKDAAPHEILAAVRSVAEGGAALGPHATRYVVDRIAADTVSQQRTRARDVLAVLTERELEIAARAAEGLSNADIAARTYCSEATVKTHLSRAMTKLGLDNRVQLAVVVDRAGLGQP